MAQVGPKLRRTQDGYAHYCPACKEMHPINVDRARPNGSRWHFSGSFEAPTFKPSVNISAEEDGVVIDRCHYFITAGFIQFQGDCTHSLKGEIVPLPDLPEGYCDN